MNTYDEMMQQVEQKQEGTRIVYEWLKFLRKHRDIRDNEANLEMFKSAFSDTRQFDAQACQLLLDDPEFVKRLSTTTEDATRAELIEAIITLLTKARSPEQLVEEGKRLQYFDVDALRSRHEELKALKEMERNTPAQLHALTRQQQRRGPEPVPASLTRAKFTKSTTKEQRLALQRYGAEAINTAWAIQEGRN
jgi:hypothetical protein